MSGKADGTIYIDTLINTDGIPDGIDNMIKDIESGTKDVEDLGEKTGEKFSEGFEKGISDMPDPIEPIEQQSKSFRDKLNSFSGSMTKFGAVTSVAVTAPLVALGGQMVSSASDMEENLNKVDVAFGNSSEAVKSWAETATESFGLSKNQALEAASLFGDMGTSMGLSKEEAADMSTSLAGLAGDLASFKNIDVEQAMTALNGVFTGETESLKTLGVVMTETNLKQFAKDAGLVYEEMTQAEKVQLRYAYVMKQTANAQGDYSRTSDGTANSMRTMQASFDNLIAILGESLLPAITPIIQFITDLLEKFSELDPETQKMIVIIAAVAAAIGPIATVIGGIASAISTLIPIIGAVVAAINPVTIAIAAAVAAIVLLIKNWDAVKAKMQEFDAYLQNIFATDFTEIFGPRLGEILNGFFQNVENIWNGIKDIFGGVIEFIQSVFSGDWKKAWESVKKIFEGIWNLMVAFIKKPINDIISMVNALVGGIAAGINAIIDLLNSLKFTVPDWVPEFGGKSFSLNIPKISVPKIPYLATGAVIPPNAPFMAMLGDQRHGMNLEAPEDLIRQIVREEAGASAEMMALLSEIAQSNQVIAEKELVIGDRDIARANMRGKSSMGYSLITTG